MAKTIINKCPNCGTWCEAEAKGLLGKMVSGWFNSVEKSSKVGEKLLGGIGGFAGSAVGTYTGIVNGAWQALVGDKFQFECPNCGAKWSTDDEIDDERELYNMECEVMGLLDSFGATCRQGKNGLETYVRKIQALLGDGRNSDLTRIYLKDMLAATYSELGDREKALESVNESLKISKDSPLSLAIKGYVIGEGRNCHDALAAMVSLINYKKFVDNEQPHLYTESQYHDRFMSIQNRYTSDFLSIHPEQRRFLYLIEGNLDDKLNQLPETVRLMPITQRPTEMEIIGMPQDNVLYICHPYKPNCYIPANEYQLELLRDELHEFCHIMECLGAKQISLSDTHTNQHEESHNNSTNISGGGSYDGYSGSASVGKQTNDALDSMIQRELSERHEFLCSKEYPPCLPPDIVWYNHRQEWQRKVKSRLEGRLIKDKYTIATSDSETIIGAKKLAIEAEVNALGALLNAAYDGSSDFTIKQTETYSQEVEVVFWPLDEYETTQKQITSPVTAKLQVQSSKNKNWIVIALVAVIVVLAVILCVVLL